MRLIEYGLPKNVPRIPRVEICFLMQLQFKLLIYYSTVEMETDLLTQFQSIHLFYMMHKFLFH